MSRRNVISPGPGSSTAGRAVTSRSLSPPRSMPISSVLNTGAGPSTSGRSRTDVHGKIVKPGASVAAVHRMVQADGSLAHAVWTVPVLRPPAQAGIATRSGDQHSVEPDEQPDPPSTRFSENWARWRRSVGNQYKCMHMKGARPCTAKLSIVSLHMYRTVSAHLRKEIRCPEPGCAKVLLGGKPSDIKRHFRSKHPNSTFDLEAWLDERKSAKKR